MCVALLKLRPTWNPKLEGKEQTCSHAPLLTRGRMLRMVVHGGPLGVLQDGRFVGQLSCGLISWCVF